MKSSRIWPPLAQVLGYSRVALYTLESLPIIYSRQFVSGVNTPDPAPPENHLEILRNVVIEMIQKDAENIRQGIYPATLLLPESPSTHLKRYWEIFVDSFSAAERSTSKLHREFSEESQDFLAELPEYYKRNFHNQTDGYLSEKSADFYRHQTEILFKGTVSLMRRILLAPLIEKINSQGRCQVLEIGCGSGEATEILLKSCPNIELTCIDLSRPYLKSAAERLKGFSNVEFLFADASRISYEDQFDAVLSCFVSHELPRDVRKQVIKCGAHALKENGTLVHIDSLQLGDTPDFDWALKQFPKDFHEPFYANYVSHPIETEMQDDFKINRSEQAFLSKSTYGTKN